MRGRGVLAAIAGLVLMAGFMPAKELCEGFLPENDMQVPMSLWSLQDGGVDEAGFNEVLDMVEEFYTPVIEELGGVLKLKRLWSTDAVNASAQRFGSSYIVNMYGGLARHPDMTKDGLTLVACHEIGHHIGGAPKIGGWFNAWATNEGQADYFAGLRCLRQLWNEEETAEFVQSEEIDQVVVNTCTETYVNPAEQNLCMRIATAGMTVTALFRALREETTEPAFDTPDPNVVERTYNSHPETQCRLDTYFQGGLCVHDMNVGLDDEDVRIGTCTETAGHVIGNRPRCWYGEAH